MNILEEVMSYDLELMFKVATLYYEKKLTQESIGRKLNISKYKVNRVLKRALIQGVVQIKINKLKVSV